MVTPLCSQCGADHGGARCPGMELPIHRTKATYGFICGA